MKLKAALEYEKIREDKECWNKIILHQDGKFYHAYEWSAWLIREFVEKGNESTLKVSLYKTSNAEYIIGGFPLESLSKYIPVYKETRPIDEKTLEVEINIGEEFDYDTLKSEFEQWRETCPMQESKKLQNRVQVTRDTNSAELGRSGLFSILSRVLSYPLESSTPINNVEFISSLKQDIAAML